MHNTAGLRAALAVAALFLVVAPRAAFAQQTTPQIPPQLSFLPSLGEVRKNIYYEQWGEFRFPPSDVPKRGQYWSVLVNLKTHDDRWVTWKALKPGFLENGWTVVKEFPPGSTIVSVSNIRNGAEAWAVVDMLPGGTVIKIDMILVGPPPISLTLAAPASTPEKLEAAKTGKTGSNGENGVGSSIRRWKDLKRRLRAGARGQVFRFRAAPSLVSAPFVAVAHLFQRALRRCS